MWKHATQRVDHRRRQTVTRPSPVPLSPVRWRHLVNLLVAVLTIVDAHCIDEYGDAKLADDAGVAKRVLKNIADSNYIKKFGTWRDGSKVSPKDRQWALDYKPFT